MKTGLLTAITEISQERELDREAVITALEESILLAAQKKYEKYHTIEVRIDRKTGEINISHFKVVVYEKDEDYNEANEITLAEAKEIDPESEFDDEIEYVIDSKDFSRVIAQTTRQMLFQKIKEIEQASIMEKYSDKVNEIVHGTVGKVDNRRNYVTIGTSTEAILEKSEQIRGEKLHPGNHIRALLLKINEDKHKNTQLIISRTHPKFLVKLMEAEIPEIYEGIIEVVAAARDAGRRAKVAVISHDPDIDAVGACVGPRGSRIQGITSELGGERIDVIEWYEMPEKFIEAALSPAEVLNIEIDEENHTAEVEVQQDQLSLAIGRQGQNVRLASNLTRYSINVGAKPEDSEDEGVISSGTEVLSETDSFVETSSSHIEEIQAEIAPQLETENREKLVLTEDKRELPLHEASHLSSKNEKEDESSISESSETTPNDYIPIQSEK